MFQSLLTYNKHHQHRLFTIFFSNIISREAKRNIKKIKRNLGFSCQVRFFEFILIVYTFYLLNLHAVIYFVHCALSLIILFYICACCDTCYFKNVCLFLFVEVKALLGLCYMLHYNRHKIKFLCLCLCLFFLFWTGLHKSP